MIIIEFKFLNNKRLLRKLCFFSQINALRIQNLFAKSLEQNKILVLVRDIR
jgi:hypothetical protein